MAPPQVRRDGRAASGLAQDEHLFAIVAAVGTADPRAPDALRPDLAGLRARIRPAALAAEDVVAPDAALAHLLGGPGLRRGSTVVVDGAPGAGGTSLLLRLLVAPSAAGAWCALVGLPSLGAVAAEELGVALDRLLLVPEAGGHLAAVVAALLEGCDVVVARPAAAFSLREAARLAARARERRAVLVVASAAVAATPAGPPLAPGRSGWLGEADVVLEALAGSWVGIGEGSGRLVAHGLEVLARHRRGAPGARRHLLWLQDHPGEPGQPGAPIEGAVAGTPTPLGPGLAAVTATGRLLRRATG